MNNENIPLPYKFTECKTCKTKERALFIMPKPIDKNDFFCKDCMVKELERRAKK